MQRTTGDWYLALIVAVLTAVSFAAVFYMQVWTSADPEFFKNVGFAGFGAVAALLTQKVVADPDPPPDPPAE